MNIRSTLSSLREYLTPINNESNFLATGEISPDEFVLAGDYLVQKFPTWTWGAPPKALHKPFLPPDKQYLVTRHVPSYRRYADFVPGAVDSSELISGAPGPHTAFSGSSGQSQNQNQTQSRQNQNRPRSEIDSDSDLEVIPSFSAPRAAAPAEEVDLEAELLEDGLDDDIDDYANIQSDTSGLRRYDMYIAYSTSYRVPKMYLVGFDANGIPLLPAQMYEDISGDHKDKTATIEALPMAQNVTGVSIHPCRHASVMRVFMEHASARGSAPAERGIRVDHYLVIFLKFIASVTPGIEYDFTMDAL